MHLHVNLSNSDTNTFMMIREIRIVMCHCPVNMFCCVCILQIVLLMCGRLYWQINLTETVTINTN